MYDILLLENVYTNENIINLIKEIANWFLKNKDTFLTKEIRLKNGILVLKIKNVEGKGSLDFSEKKIVLTFSKKYLESILADIRKNFSFFLLYLIKELSVVFAYFSAEKVRIIYNRLTNMRQADSENNTKIQNTYNLFNTFLEKTTWFQFFSSMCVLSFDNREKFKHEMVNLILFILRNKERLYSDIERENYSHIQRIFKNLDRFIIIFVFTFLVNEKTPLLKQVIIKLLDSIYEKFDKIKGQITYMLRKINIDDLLKEK